MVKALLEFLTKHFLTSYASRQCTRASGRMSALLDPEDLSWTQENYNFLGPKSKPLRQKPLDK